MNVKRVSFPHNMPIQFLRLDGTLEWNVTAMSMLEKDSQYASATFEGLPHGLAISQPGYYTKIVPWTQVVSCDIAQPESKTKGVEKK